MGATLTESNARLTEDEADERGLSINAVVNEIIAAHYHKKHMESLPPTKEIIVANLKNINVGATFTVIDVMDAEHKREARKRGDYGRMIALLIARNQIPVEFTGVMKGTYRVYRKLR